MHTVLGGYIDCGEMPGLVALVSCGEAVHVEVQGALSFGGTPMKRDFDLPHRLDAETHYRRGRDDPGRGMQTSGSTIRLDEFLPELANRKVLRRLDAPLDDVVPAKNALSPCSIFSPSAGDLGAVMLWPPAYPIQKAMEAAGLMPGPNPVEQTRRVFRSAPTV